MSHIKYRPVSWDGAHIKADEEKLISEMAEVLLAFYRAAEDWHRCHHTAAKLECDLFCEQILPAKTALQKAGLL